ncbi:MAG: BatA domain-containing protein, partial [Pseudomonadota bacterium]
MLTLGPLGFTAPWLLLGLIALPILWILLRAVPPAPIRRRFPGVALLLGLDDDESQTDRTPWWLLLLRMLAIAAVIIGFAGPVLNPDPREAGRGPLLVLVDGTWADASDWTARIDRVRAVLSEARRDDRTVALATTTDLPPEGPTFQAPGAWLPRLVNLRPQPWEPEQADLADWGAALTGDFDTFWLSDGLDRPGRQDLLLALEARGDVAVFQSPRSSLGLRPAEFVDGQVALD